MGFFSAQASKDNNRVAREKARAVFERGVSMYRPEAICSTEIVGLTDDRQVFVLNSALDRLAVFVSRPNESAYNFSSRLHWVCILHFACAYYYCMEQPLLFHSFSSSIPTTISHLPFP